MKNQWISVEDWADDGPRYDVRTWGITLADNHVVSKIMATRRMLRKNYLAEVGA